MHAYIHTERHTHHLSPPHAINPPSCVTFKCANTYRCRQITSFGLQQLLRLPRLRTLLMYGVHHAGTAEHLLQALEGQGTQIEKKKQEKIKPAHTTHNSHGPSRQRKANGNTAKMDTASCCDGTGTLSMMLQPTNHSHLTGCHIFYRPLPAPLAAFEDSAGLVQEDEPDACVQPTLDSTNDAG